jgi:hypothetical protein
MVNGTCIKIVAKVVKTCVFLVKKLNVRTMKRNRPDELKRPFSQGRRCIRQTEYRLHNVHQSNLVQIPLHRYQHRRFIAYCGGRSVCAL